MIVAKCTDEGIARCLEIVTQGGVIVFPTDTVYGIGCDPCNESAVERVFKIKRRDENKPMPILVGDTSQAEALVDLGKSGKLLASIYWPGPLTIVAPPRDDAIPSRITAGSRKLGVRVPANKCILSLLKHCKRLVGTSANISGDTSLKSADDVQQSGLTGFDILLDGGAVSSGRESTIIDLSDRRIIREGAISSQEILKVLAVGGP
jgi:L-threonylcarbamoyladenylate synthase